MNDLRLFIRKHGYTYCVCKICLGIKTNWDREFYLSVLYIFNSVQSIKPVSVSVRIIRKHIPSLLKHFDAQLINCCRKLFLIIKALILHFKGSVFVHGIHNYRHIFLTSRNILKQNSIPYFLILVNQMIDGQRSKQPRFKARLHDFITIFYTISVIPSVAFHRYSKHPLYCNTVIIKGSKWHWVMILIQIILILPFFVNIFKRYTSFIHKKLHKPDILKKQLSRRSLAGLLPNTILCFCRRAIRMVMQHSFLLSGFFFFALY